MRLTERFSNGQAAVAGCGDNCKYDYKYCKFNDSNCPTLDEIYEKLAFYEDLEDKGELPVVYDVNVHPCTNCEAYKLWRRMCFNFYTRL